LRLSFIHKRILFSSDRKKEWKKKDRKRDSRQSLDKDREIERKRDEKVAFLRERERKGCIKCTKILLQIAGSQSVFSSSSGDDRIERACA